MKKTPLKRLGAVLLALVMICGCISVWAEETTYKYIDVAAEGETTIKTWTGSYTSEMSGCSKASGGGETFVWFNSGNYVVFRANVLETGIYDISVGWGCASAASPQFAVTVDEGEAQSAKPEYSGLGNYVPEYKQVLTTKLEKGNHTIKVSGTVASGALMGIKLKCVAGEMEIEGAEANGASFVEYPFVSTEVKSLTVNFSEELDKGSVTTDTVTLTSGENSVSITPKAEGKVMTVALNENLVSGNSYKLTLNGITDKYEFTTITDVSYTFTAYEGSISTIKYPDIVIEAEDFTEAGIYSGSDAIDATAVTTATSGDVTYVEFDNWDYIKVPFTVSTQAHYTICYVYASDSDVSVSVSNQYQKTAPQTGSLETFKTFNPNISSKLYSSTTYNGYIRPQSMAEGAKFRLDKLIIKRGMSIPEDGKLSVRGFWIDNDSVSQGAGKENVADTPMSLYNGAWGEYVYNFPESGYYNFSVRATTYAGNAMNFVVTVDEKQLFTKQVIAQDGYVGSTSTNPTEFGTYYFEKGFHVIKIQNTTAAPMARAFDILFQRVDTTDGIIANAVDSTNYTEGVTPGVVTLLATGQQITMNVQTEENGYYSVNALLSNVNAAAAEITVTVDDVPYVVNVAPTGKLRAISQQKVADVYLPSGTHTVKVGVTGEGYLDSTRIGVGSVRLYAPKVEYTGLTEGNSQATVKLNGLFSSKAVDCIIAVYKGNQLYKVDYDKVDNAINGSEFILSLSDVGFEEGITYKAKLFIWSNMTGECYEYSVH